MEVQDIVFQMELDDEGDEWPSMTVYFHEPVHKGTDAEADRGAQ